MRDLNLVLKYRLLGDDDVQIRGVARIKIDGRGGLTFLDVQSGSVTQIELRHLQSFSVIPIRSHAGI